MESAQAHTPLVRSSDPLARATRSTATSVAGVIAVLAASWALGWVLGGAGRVPPHWFYVPILMAASRFGVAGAVPAALAAGVLAGPLLPLHVAGRIPQAVSDWGSRAGFFLGLGILMAWLVDRHRRAVEARETRGAELETLRAIDLSILGVAPFAETLTIARDAMHRLLPADRLGLILRSTGRSTLRRMWVSVRGSAHDVEEPVPDGGPIVEALNRTEPVASRIDPERSDWERELAAEGLRTFLLVPLVSGDEVLGILSVSSRRAQVLSGWEVDTAVRIAGQLAVALQAGSLRSEVEHRVAELEAIRGVSEAAGASLDLHRVLEAVLDRSLEATGLQVGMVSLVEGSGPELRLMAERNLPDPIRSAVVRISPRDSVLGPVVREGRPEIIPRLDAGRVLQEAGAGGPEVSLIAVPLEWAGKVAGMIALGSFDGEGVSEESLELLVALARPAAAAVGNARLYEGMKELEEQRHRLVSQLVTAQEEERRRVAGDLHDDAVQVMAAVAMRLDLMRKRTIDPAQQVAVENAAQETRAAVRRLRRMLFEIRPPSLDREGLAAPIQAYLHELEEEAGMQTTLQARLSTEPAAEARVLLYRIAQEALTNVRKHAEAHHVAVHLEGGDGGFHLRIEDDGKGFPLDESSRQVPGHLGLPTMRERAEMVGGRFRVRSVPGRGTVVETWIPGERVRAGA